MPNLESYIFFDGQCEEAFTYYAQIFETTPDFSRFSDMPAGIPADNVIKSRIMNVSLPVGDSFLRGSDLPSTTEKSLNYRSFNIVVNPNSKEEADHYFNNLSKNGKVSMPMENTFWGAYFGMCQDKFGVQWMISYDSQRS